MDETQTPQAESSNDTAYADIYSEDGAIRADYLDRIDRFIEEDTEAAHRMVTSHLRLAAKIAMGYRGYGLPQAEVISEANVGLMQAVKRFDPEKG